MARSTAVEYRVSADGDRLAEAAAEHFLKKTSEAAAARGRARVAVSGGRTPKATFALLTDPARPYLKQMPWERLELYFVDERCVPPDSVDSNYRMTRETMLERSPMRPEQIVRIEGEQPPEEAAARYESAIRGRFRLEGAELPRFDIVQLGMGGDGHTASLFPHTGALDELGRIAVANHVPQQTQSWRITLTWPVIVEAAHVFFLVESAEKAAPLHAVLEGPYEPEEYPSQLIQPASGKLLLLLDREAAAKLPPTDANGVGRLEIVR